MRLPSAHAALDDLLRKFNGRAFLIPDSETVQNAWLHLCNTTIDPDLLNALEVLFTEDPIRLKMVGFLERPETTLFEPMAVLMDRMGIIYGFDSEGCDLFVLAPTLILLMERGMTVTRCNVLDDMFE